MKVIKPGADRDVPRGVVGGAEISQATAGAHNIYMGVFRVPAGARSRPHYHADCESAVYMLSRHARRPLGRAPRRSPCASASATWSTSRRARRTSSRTPPADEPAEYVVARDAPTEDSVEVPWADEPPPT